ncbi:hypothetical protein DYH09_19455 [bacterium CPR1]|nr:hypothetical protein [bacterium CPR1]
MFVAPVLAYLGDLGRRFGEGQAELSDLEQAGQAALSFCRDHRFVFERVACSIVIDRTVAELQRQYRAELEAQEQALERLLQTAREGRLRGLQEALGQVMSTAGRCQELAAQLRAEEEKRPRYSPVSEVDQFIKVGINVLNGALPAVELESRLGGTMKVVEGLALDVERFRRLYDRSDLVQPSIEPLAQMRAGLGAVAQAFREASSQTLLDGLKLLGAGSTGMLTSLRAFEQVARAQSCVPFLNELRLGQERLHPEADRELIRQLWGRVEQIFYHYENEVRSVRELSLFPLLEAEWSRTDTATRELGRELTRAAPIYAENPRGIPLAALEGGFERVHQGLEELWRRLEAEMGKLAEAPQFELLRELVLQVARGRASRQDLERALEHNRKLQEELLSEVQGEMADLLAAQGEAYAEIALFLQDDDPAHLLQGWTRLEATLPRMIELVKAARASLGAQSPQQVSCFRCGAVNPPGQGFCRSCKAVLGSSTGPTEYTDITAGPPRGRSPAHLARLEQLVAGFEGGASSRDELIMEIDRQMDRADDIWRQFEAQVSPLTGQNEALDAYVHFFIEQMSNYMEGLEAMREGDLYHGLSLCQASGHELVGLKARIEEALR